MFFTAALRSKLAALLRPWVDGEPELEINLGFLSWAVRAKNLVLSPSVLDPSIVNSTRLEFKRFGVAEVMVRVSLWSSPNFVLEVRGIDVILAPRELVGDRRVIRRDFSAERRKEVIALVDPEGTSLDEIIRSSSTASSSGHWLTRYMATAVVRHCQVQLCNIDLKLQSNKSEVCLLEVGDIILEPQLLDQDFLFRKSGNSLLASGNRTILSISCNTVKFKLKENDHVCCNTSLMGLSVAVRLDNLQPRNYGISITSVDFQLSPIIIPTVMIILDLCSPEALNSIRSGQELWEIARGRIGQLTVNTTLNLHKVVNTVVLWARYVRAYEALLLLVGYSVHDAMAENISSMSSHTKLLNRVHHQWRAVCELEERLPAEAVARARRIARHRALAHPGSVDLKLSSSLLSTYLLKILSPICLIWRAIYMILHLVVRLCCMWQHHGENRQPVLFLPSLSTCHESHLQHHISLNLEKICITYSQAIYRHAPISGKGPEPPIKLPSICLLLKSLLLIYVVDCLSKSLFTAFGELKLHLNSSARVSKSKNDVKNSIPSVSWRKTDTGIESKICLWTEPANKSIHQQNEGLSASSHSREEYSSWSIH